MMNQTDLIYKWPEVLYVIEGVKPVARLRVPKDKLIHLKNFLLENGVYNISSFTKGDPNYLYISQDEDKVYKAHMLEEIKDNRKLGRLLGYPECCINFFCTHSHLMNKITMDLSLYSLSNTHRNPPYPFYTNNIVGHFGYGLISHFPCKYTCTESIKLGKKYFDVINDYSPDLAHRIKQILVSPILYTEHDGIFLFKEYSMLSNTSFSYNTNEIISRSDHSEIQEIIKCSNNVKFMGKNHVAFYQDSKLVNTLKDENINLFLFK